nr:AlNc14C174G8085 [Albugo laibachii Nc14]|eukprot:CCA22968.1 AlNc14C174G8085 [Albugo laibachii Nc14]
MAIKGIRNDHGSTPASVIRITIALNLLAAPSVMGCVPLQYLYQYTFVRNRIEIFLVLLVIATARFAVRKMPHFRQGVPAIRLVNTTHVKVRKRVCVNAIHDQETYCSGSLAGATIRHEKKFLHQCIEAQ